MTTLPPITFLALTAGPATVPGATPLTGAGKSPAAGFPAALGLLLQTAAPRQAVAAAGTKLPGESADATDGNTDDGDPSTPADDTAALLPTPADPDPARAMIALFALPAAPLPAAGATTQAAAAGIASTIAPRLALPIDLAASPREPTALPSPTPDVRSPAPTVAASSAVPPVAVATATLPMTSVAMPAPVAAVPTSAAGAPPSPVAVSSGSGESASALIATDAAPAVAAGPIQPIVGRVEAASASSDRQPTPAFAGRELERILAPATIAARSVDPSIQRAVAPLTRIAAARAAVPVGGGSPAPLTRAKLAQSGDGETAIATSTVAPLPVLAVATADQPALDLSDRRWPAAMVDHIERLRDAADAADTRIRVMPDALGPIDIAVRRSGEAVDVTFTAAHEATRAMLADAQPALVTIAADRGVAIGRTSVDAPAALVPAAASAPQTGDFTQGDARSFAQSPAQLQAQTQSQSQSQSQSQPQPQAPRLPLAPPVAPSFTELADDDASAATRIA